MGLCIKTKIEAAILEGNWPVFFSYWWVITTLVLCFSFGARQLSYNTHTSIKAAKIVTLKPFPSSTNFDPDWGSLISTAVQSAFTNYFTICLKIYAIQTTNQSLVKSCLRCLLVTWYQSQAVLLSLPRRNCVSWPVNFACSSPTHRQQQHTWMGLVKHTANTRVSREWELPVHRT